MAKQLLLTDSDLPFLQNIGKIVSEGKYEIKGDTIIPIANALKYLAQFQERVKQAPDVPASQLISEAIERMPVVPLAPDAAPVVPAPRKKKG